MGRYVAYVRAVSTLFEQAVIIAAQAGSLTRAELEAAWAHATQTAEPLLRSIAVNLERENSVYFRKLIGRALPRADVRHSQRSWVTAGLQLLADVGKKQIEELLVARADSDEGLDAREDALPRAAKARVNEARKANVALIGGTNLKQHVQLIELFKGAQASGARHESLAEKVQAITGAGLKRAKLIARDQTVKYNATVRQEQARSLGIRKYVWRTSGDEAVRTFHKKLNGHTFSYDEPPVTDSYGHRHNPGEDYNCRCVDEPQIDLFAGLDADLGDTLVKRKAQGKQATAQASVETTNPLQAVVNKQGVRASNYLRTGMRDLTHARSQYAGKTVREAQAIAEQLEHPVRIHVEPDGRGGKTVILNDGRHRMTAAAEAGATHINAHVVEYGPRGGKLREFKGIVKL